MKTYHVLRDKTDIAIKNAKKDEKHNLNLGQALDNENWCSGTAHLAGCHVETCRTV